MQSQNPVITQTAVRVPSGKALTSIGIILLLILLIAGTVFQTSAPDPVPASASATDFSSERALKHVEVIAAKPRPSGSPEHLEVQKYLINQITALGLQPEIQKATAIRTFPGATFDRTGYVENVMVRVKGTGGEGKAILLSANYDTWPHLVGAAKNAASVATLLETMRALKAGEPLQNDVIFLFTDGLESFLMGSQAFVDEHPWAKDVGLVLNFDSRGTGGPVFMAETSSENGWVIQEFAEAAPHPLANSLMHAVLKLMPKNMDNGVYNEELNAPSMNFLFANEAHRYKNQLDTMANLEESTIQHQGSYALALTQHFGNIAIENEAKGKAVFFNIAGLTLITYSMTWIWPLTAITALVLLSALVYGIRNKRLTVKGVLIGFLMFLLLIVAAAAAVALVWLLVPMLTNAFALKNHAAVFMAGFTALGLSVIAGLSIWFLKKWSLANLSVGAALWWLLLMVATAVLLPDAHYLFAWPLLFSSFGLWYMVKAKEQGTTKSSWILFLFALPAIVLGAQIFYLLYIMLANDLPPVLTVILVLFAGLMFPQLQAVLAPRKVVLPVLSLLVSLGFLLSGVLMPAYSEAAPKTDVLFYSAEADTGKAHWNTINPAKPDLDEFNSPYVGGGQKADFGNFLPAGSGAFVYQAEAKYVPLKTADVQVLEDNTVGETRKLHLKIQPTDLAVNMILSMTSEQPLVTGALNGKPWKNHDTVPTRWETIFAPVPASGIDLVLDLKKGQNLKLNAVQVTDGLPAELNVERPKDIVATYFSDLTYVSKTFSF